MSYTPIHLLPDHCYICGGTEHEFTGTHRFWSNADMEQKLREEEQRTAGHHVEDVAARYVAEHRPY